MRNYIYNECYKYKKTECLEQHDILHYSKKKKKYKNQKKLYSGKERTDAGTTEKIPA